MRYPFFRRRRIVVKPAFQLKVALAVVVFLALYSLLLGFLIFYPLQQALLSSRNLEEQAEISRQILELHTRIWPGMAVVALLIGVQTLFLSHRIAGPLYRIERTLRAMIDGDFSQRIKLRKHDEFKEFEEVVNQLAGTLQMLVEENRRFKERLNQRVQELNHWLGQESFSPDKARALVMELGQELEAQEAVSKRG